MYITNIVFSHLICKLIVQQNRRFCEIQQKPPKRYLICVYTFSSETNKKRHLGRGAQALRTYPASNQRRPE